MNKPEIRDVVDRGMLEYYLSSRSKPYFDNCRYVAVFLSAPKNEAIFIGLYWIEDCIVGAAVKDYMPEGYPYPLHFDNTHRFYIMKKLDTMGDLVDKHIIDWGKRGISLVSVGGE